MALGITGNRLDKFKSLKVPKCEIFDPFFYTDKSYMGRLLEDWINFCFFRRQIFAILVFLRMLSLRRLSLR